MKTTLLKKSWRGRVWHQANPFQPKSIFAFKNRSINYDVLKKIFTNPAGEITEFESSTGEKIDLTNKKMGKRGRKRKFNIVFPQGNFTIKQVAILNNTSPANINNELVRLKVSGDVPRVVGFEEKKEKTRGKKSKIYTFDSNLKEVVETKAEPPKSKPVKKVKYYEIKQFKNKFVKPKVKKKLVKAARPCKERPNNKSKKVSKIKPKKQNKTKKKIKSNKKK